MNTKLWSHQEAIVRYMHSREAGMVYAGMGTGKTLSTLAWVWQAEVSRTLVLTKKRIVDVWVEEAEKFGFVEAGVRVFTGVDGWSVARFADEVKKFLTDGDPNPKVVVLNYEKIWREPLFSVLLKGGFDALVLDESHKVKSHSSYISTAAFKLSQRIERRYLLTGTPMPNGPIDMFGQWRIINPKLIEVVPGSKAFDKFRAHYALLEPVRGAGPGIYKITGYQRMDEFQEKMQRTTLKIKTEDVLDLPPEQHITRHVSLASKTMRQYRELARELILEVEGGYVLASNVLVKALRLQQITGGFVNTSDGKIAAVDTAKLDMTLDILEDLPPDEPVVIFAKFTPEINALKDVLGKAGYTVSVLSGSVNQLKDWKAGTTQVLVVQVDTGAEGISLTRSQYAILYSVGYSLGTYEQLLARQRRPGQEGDRVVYYHLIAKGTIDETVNEALQNKREVTEAILGELSSYGQQHHAV